MNAKKEYRHVSISSTRHSLRSFARHISKIGTPLYVRGIFSGMHKGTPNPWYRVVIRGTLGYITLCGCSWGYRGEGSRGTEEVLIKLGVAPAEAANIAFGADNSQQTIDKAKTDPHHIHEVWRVYLRKPATPNLAVNLPPASAEQLGAQPTASPASYAQQAGRAERPKVLPVQSIAELNQKAKFDLGYRELALKAASNLGGGDVRELRQAIEWLYLNAQEGPLGEQGVVDEINFCLELVGKQDAPRRCKGGCGRELPPAHKEDYCDRCQSGLTGTHAPGYRSL